MKLFITKSKRKNKKYDLLDENKKYILSFGDARFEDYTMHKDPDRRERYLLRHGKEDHTKNNIKSAAFMSAHLLWGKPTLEASIRDVNKRFNINIKLI